MAEENGLNSKINETHKPSTGVLFRRQVPTRTGKEAAVPKKKKKRRKKKTPPDISSSQQKHSLVPYHMNGDVFTVFDYFRPVKVIGTGAYATVIEAIDMRTGTKVAIKKNKNVFNDLKDSKRMLREMKLLMRFQQDDVVKLLDVIPPEDAKSFNNIFLVMPRMETTLENLIKSDKKITNKHITFFTYQIFRGLKYIHSANIVHRDIKPANILINGRNCKIKITDFGLARGVSDSLVNPMTEYVCTRWYRAPEVIFGGKQKYDEKIDIWAAACIMTELFTRKMPLLPGNSGMDQLRLIIETIGKPTDYEWIQSPEVRKYINELPIPEDAESLQKKLEDCESNEAVILLERCLALNPNERLSAVEILQDSYFSSLHNESTEKSCDRIPSVLSPEEEASCQTEFGLRHVMFEALTSYHARVKLQMQQKAAFTRKQQLKAKQSKKNQKRNSLNKKKSALRGVQEDEPQNNNIPLFGNGQMFAGTTLLESLNEEMPMQPKFTADANRMLMGLFEASDFEVVE